MRCRGDTSAIFAAWGTGSLRRLSLDISNVPGIVAPPRDTQLFAN